MPGLSPSDSLKEAEDAAVLVHVWRVRRATARPVFRGRAGLMDANAGDLAIADPTRLVRVAWVNPIDVQTSISANDLHSVRDAIAGRRDPRLILLGADGTPDGREACIHQFNPRLLVATAALASRLDQQIVCLVLKGAVHPQPVVATEGYGSKTAIESGLKAGAELAASNFQRPHGGTTVRPVDARDRMADR